MRETVVIDTPLAFAISTIVIFLNFVRFPTDKLPFLVNNEYFRN